MKTEISWLNHTSQKIDLFRRFRYLAIAAFFTILLFGCGTDRSETPKNGSTEVQIDGLWKAGVSSSIITPEEDLWMSGYAAREKPAQGKIHDIWVKALALEDTKGKRVLFITCDIVGFPRVMSQEICARIQEKYGMDRSEIVLSSSHNHSGPVVNENLFFIYPPFDDHQQKAIKAYGQWLQSEIVSCAGKAMDNLSPATLSSGIGIARFAVNRRNNVDSEVLNSSQLAGPSDHTVPVITVSTPEGTLKSLVFGYACHATCLDLCEWSGDYPGFAQLELEAAFPGAKALFFAGCGGDQNPIPRRTVALAAQYGEELSAAVKRVLKEPMKDLAPNLQTHYNEISLAFSEALPMDSLKAISKDRPAYEQRWAENLMTEIRNGVTIPENYPYYPIQNWMIGDQRLLMLGGEVVVDYALRIKKNWGNDLFVVAYANDVMAYIPSLRVLNEGGYEGKTSMRVYNHPSTWAPEVEEVIIEEVNRQLGNH